MVFSHIITITTIYDDGEIEKEDYYRDDFKIKIDINNFELFKKLII